MKSRGFTLVEIVVVLFILGIVTAMAFTLLRAVTANRQANTTTAALANVQAALVNYVMLTRRLPCPADGGLPGADPNAGRERRTGNTCDNNQARGVVPWVTLGLKEADILDGYASRITYRVAPDAAVDSALWMTSCDAAGTGAAVAGNPGRCADCPDKGVGVPDICTPPANALAARGLTVQTAGGAIVNDGTGTSGAAYVLVSAGENRAGAYTSSGVVQPGTLSGAEIQNEAADALKAYYVDDQSIDDVVMHPTILVVVNAANLGPRIHRPFGS